MFQHREHCAAMNDDVGQPLGVALEQPNLNPNPNPNPSRNPLTATPTLIANRNPNPNR